MLNKSKGNMYPFVTHTWNTVKGACPHGCSYCYMKRFGEQPPLHFDKKELKTPLVDPETGKDGLFIFVGSSCDMWAVGVWGNWISSTLEHCLKYDNRYLFQSKCPTRFMVYESKLPHNSILGTTLESNIDYPSISGHRTPPPDLRWPAMRLLKNEGWRIMITIEPILDFDLKPFVEMLQDIEPSWINIGADSQGHNLPEPPAEKVRELIAELERFTEVKIKPNLKRITA